MEVSGVKRILAIAGMLAALWAGPLSGAALAQETTQPPADQPVLMDGVSPVDPATVTDPAAPAEPQWVGPEVKLETSMGDIIIVLDMVGAPKTAKQFMGLVKGKHYDGAIVYRVETVQGMDVVDAIAGVELAPPGEKHPFPGKLPLTPVVIKKATVARE
jgi:hypothetical protein